VQLLKVNIYVSLVSKIEFYIKKHVYGYCGKHTTKINNYTKWFLCGIILRHSGRLTRPIAGILAPVLAQNLD